MTELGVKPDDKTDPEDLVMAARGERRSRIAQKRAHGRIMEITRAKGISRNASLGWHRQLDLRVWVERTMLPVREHGLPIRAKRKRWAQRANEMCRDCGKEVETVCSRRST